MIRLDRRGIFSFFCQDHACTRAHNRESHGYITLTVEERTFVREILEAGLERKLEKLNLRACLDPWN